MKLTQEIWDKLPTGMNNGFITPVVCFSCLEVRNGYMCCWDKKCILWALPIREKCLILSKKYTFVPELCWLDKL